MANPDLKNRELREGHLKWTTHRCRGRATVAAAMIWLVGLAYAAGCVEAAECDDDVSCQSDEVCFQARCLPECDEDADCEEGRRCAPCQPDDGTDRCPESRAGGCVDES